jgi:hypothetical protein
MNIEKLLAGKGRAEITVLFPKFTSSAAFFWLILLTVIGNLYEYIQNFEAKYDER